MEPEGESGAEETAEVFFSRTENEKTRSKR